MYDSTTFCSFPPAKLYVPWLNHRRVAILNSCRSCRLLSQIRSENDTSLPNNNISLAPQCSSVHFLSNGYKSTLLWDNCSSSYSTPLSENLSYSFQPYSTSLFCKHLDNFPMLLHNVFGQTNCRLSQPHFFSVHSLLPRKKVLLLAQIIPF